MGIKCELTNFLNDDMLLQGFRWLCYAPIYGIHSVLFCFLILLKIN